MLAEAALSGHRRRPERQYAAIGTDVVWGVWGMGTTEEAALADAAEQDDDAEIIATLQITAAQAAAIEAGTVGVEDLGIEITRDDAYGDPPIYRFRNSANGAVASGR